MTLQFCHECLAETHDFIVALSVRIEIAAALAAADRQCCQAVLENLFESEEFENTEVNGRVESEASLVRADRAVELYTVTLVDAGLAFIINPGNTEHHSTLRFYQSFQKRCCFVLRMSFDNRLDGSQNFSYSLMKFRLIRILRFCLFDDSLYILAHVISSILPDL